MPIDQREIDHLEGKHVVVKRWYVSEDGTADVVTSLIDDEAMAAEMWVEDAFTNGPPLARIEIIWSPDEAEKLRSGNAE